MKIFNISPLDKTNKIATDIGVIGLKRIQHLLNREGISFDPLLVVLPDASPSRNIYRCTSGFITGAKYVWGNGDVDLLPIGFNANACGFTIFGFDKLPDAEILFSKLENIKRNQVEIDGTAIVIDLNKSNHFLGIFEVQNLLPNNPYPFKYISLVHCSAPEFKANSKFGFGLDYNSSNVLKEKAKSYETPDGIIHYVQGGVSKRYYELYQYSEWFASEKRKKISQLILDDGEYIDDRMHLGYDSINSCVLGNQTSKGDSEYIPFLTGPNSNSFLVKPSKKLSNNVLSNLNSTEMSVEQKKYIESIEVIPHSAGYELDYINDSSCIYNTETGIMQIIINSTAGNKMILKNASDLPYGYKGEEVLDWCEKTNLLNRTHLLRPKICLRF